MSMTTTYIDQNLALEKRASISAGSAFAYALSAIPGMEMMRAVTKARGQLTASARGNSLKLSSSTPPIVLGVVGSVYIGTSVAKNLDVMVRTNLFWPAPIAGESAGQGSRFRSG